MKDDRAFLLHIRDAAARIVEYTADETVDFHSERRTQDAVIRNLEIIGEAAKNVSEATKARDTSIPCTRAPFSVDRVSHWRLWSRVWRVS